MTKLMPDSAQIAKPAESSKRVTAAFGTISDGAGNMKYAQNSNRRWVVSCPNASSYRFQFSKLKVKQGDKVKIYNGGTEASGVKKEYSGSYLMAACNDYSSLGDAIHAFAHLGGDFRVHDRNADRGAVAVRGLLRADDLGVVVTVPAP